MNIKEANRLIVQNVKNDLKGFASYEETKSGTLIYLENDSFGKLSILVEDDITVYINFDTLYVQDKFVSYQFIDTDDEIDDEYVELTTRWIKNLLFEADTMRYCIEHYGACGEYKDETEEGQTTFNLLLQNTVIGYGNHFENLLTFKASYKEKELLKTYLSFISTEMYFKSKFLDYKSEMRTRKCFKI